MQEHIFFRGCPQDFFQEGRNNQGPGRGKTDFSIIFCPIFDSGGGGKTTKVPQISSIFPHFPELWKNRENCRITFHTLHFCFSVPKLLLRMNAFHDRRPTLQNITKCAKSYGAIRCNFGPFPKIPGANNSAVVRDIKYFVPQVAVV